MQTHFKSKLVLLVLAFPMLLLAQTHDPHRSADYPDFIIFTEGGNMDSTFDINSAELIPVVYRVNKYTLIENEALDSVVAVLRRVQGDSRTSLRRVWVGGSASPEGPLWWNRQLGDYRSAALANYLIDKGVVADSLITVFNLEEDWYNTEAYLRSHPFLNGERVLEIIASEPDRVRRKQLIRQIDGGATWHCLIAEVFPPLRNARLIIECTPWHDPDLEVAAINIPTAIPLDTPKLLPPPIWCNLNTLQPTFEPQPRFIALKNNLLFTALLTSNLAVEVELWPHVSIDVPVWYSPYDITDRLRLRLLATQPEVRYWPTKAGEGWFCGVHTHIVGFDVSTPSTDRYQDPNHALWGVGISGGWAKNFGREKQWTIEFNLGVGYANYKYDVYRNWHNGVRFDSGSGHYWGVTRAGISIGYKWYLKR